MDRKIRERLLREAVARALREFEARARWSDDESTAGLGLRSPESVGSLDLPQRSRVPDTLRELVES